MATTTLYPTSTTGASNVSSAANLLGAPDDIVATALAPAGSSAIIYGVFTWSTFPDDAVVTGVKVGIRTAKTTGANGGTNQLNTYQASTRVETFDAVANATTPLTTFEFQTTDPRWLTVATLKTMRLRWVTVAPTGASKTSVADAMWITVTTQDAVTTRAKRWSGSAWVDAPMKRWNGSAWVDATVKRWDGSAWV